MYKRQGDDYSLSRNTPAIISIMPEPLYIVSFSDKKSMEIATVINGNAEVMGTTFDVSPSFSA